MTIYRLEIVLSQFSNQSVVPCPVLNVLFLTCIRFLRRQVKYSVYSQLIKNFPQFVVIHTVKGVHVVNEAEVDVFQDFPCFLHDPTYVGNFITGSSASSKPNLYIQMFSVHILLKPSLKDLEHNLASM